MSTPRVDYITLLNNQTIREKYAVAVKNRFEMLENEGKTQWETFKDATVSTSKTKYTGMGSK